MVGETFQTIIGPQFENLRDGDRLWFENQGFDPRTLRQIEGTSLSDVILRNSDIQAVQTTRSWRPSGIRARPAGSLRQIPEAAQLVIGSDGTDTLIGGPLADTLVAGTGRRP